jgi:alanine racemase
MPVSLTDPSRVAHALINIGALRENLRKVKSIAPGSKVMSVIKANAYGHGLIRVAGGLSESDAFAVARTQEGIELRKAGFTQRIAVLQGFFDQDELAIYGKLSLEPVVHSAWQVDLLQSRTRGYPLKVWLKVDTGMSRLGVHPNEVEALHQRLQKCKTVHGPVSMMTHLANADSLDDPFTNRQIARFNELTADPEGERGLANSAGVLGWSDAHAEWVRPGIILYGISPFAGKTGKQEGLHPVMTLRSRIISIKDVEPGTRVGYGGDWVAGRKTKLGVAAIGYGDGYPRMARSGTPVLVRGQRVPLAGRVSMDMITIDLTDCPGAQIGDLVTLWGEGLPVELIAEYANTIPYDLVCGITRRVQVIET